MRRALVVLVLLMSACRPARPIVVVLDTSVHDGEGLDLQNVVVVRFDPSTMKLSAVLEEVGRDLPERLILVSDGDLPVEGLEAAVRPLVKDGATLGAVCLESSKFDAGLMSRVAEWGRGRFIFIQRAQDLPKILAQESRTALRN